VILLLLAACGWAAYWTVRPGPPPADFTFVNGTEIKSVDPAMVTGQPEGRIIMALFEGLVRPKPDTLEPIPGVARRWEISEDRLTYTFHLRDDARWSDGTPLTAHDFAYSFRRFLDPLTAAEYAYQLWYVRRAEKYSKGAAALEPGDPVEIELPLTEEQEQATPGARGKLLRGTLVEIAKPPADAGSSDQEQPAPDTWVFAVRRDDKLEHYSTAEPAPSGATGCRQILLDFSSVGIEAVGERTLQIDLENATPFFLHLMGFYPLSPVQRSCVERHGYPAWTRPENLVCNGAYRLESRRIRDRIRLVKNEHYWNRDAVAPETIDALAVEADNTAFNLYMTGRVDWIPNVPHTVIPELLDQDRPDFQPSPQLTVYFYRLNTTRPPLGDARVRQALSLAIDREEIVRTVTQAGEVPARSLVPPGITTTAKQDGEPVRIEYQRALCEPHDPKRAQELLAEAGYPGGQGFPKLEILYNASEQHAAIAQLIQAQWREALQIDAGPRQEEWNSYLTSQRTMQYTVARAGWIGDYLDPNTFLDMFVGGGANNRTGFASSRYDRLIAAAAREQDPARRFELLHDAEAILMRELPIIPVYFSVSKNMVRPYVKGFYPNLQDIHPLWAVSIDEAERRTFRAEAGWR